MAAPTNKSILNEAFTGTKHISLERRLVAVSAFGLRKAPLTNDKQAGSNANKNIKENIKPFDRGIDK